MKKLFKKLGLSFATVMCVACVGVGAAFGLNGVLSAANAESAIDFYVSGAGVRLINDANGTGIRFHTRMADADYEKLTDGDKTGTLIIPEIRYDGELTLDDLNKEAKYRPVHIDTTDIWWDAYVDGYMQSTAYLYNVPESAYGARYVARSYVEYANGDIVYTAAAPYTSMSDVATKVINSNETELKKTQVVPYVVDEVTVKYVMPDGSTETETVAYGSKLSGPTYNRESYAINATEQYGNVINFATYEATLPVTIDVELTAKPKTTAVAGQLITGLYESTNPYTAWSNGKYGTAVTEGIPNGYSSMRRLDWYQQSTSQWVAGTNTNPLYRTQFNQNDISAYDRVTFAMKLETNGDAYVAARNKAVNFGNNKWLYFELIQTSANVWTLTITDDAGAELYKVTDIKADTKTNGSGLSNDYDSVASLVFSRTGYYGAVSGDTSKWEAMHMVALYPCTSQEMTASVYFTEILGYSEDVLAIPSEAITVADAVAVTGTTNPNFTIVDNTEKAPAFFNSVTAFKSEKQWGGSYILGAGDFTAVNVKNYSEVWFAVKMVNGCITETAPAWKDVDSYTTSPWIYFHLIQQDNTMTDTSGNPTIAWTIEIMKDGKVWDTITDQHANANDTIGRILDWSNDSGRIVFYQNRNNLGEPTYLYSTEVRGILKDGVTPPSSGTTETTTAMDIPDNAVPVRSYIMGSNPWAFTIKGLSEDAPEGYSYLVENVWNTNHPNITSSYFGTVDQEFDITPYSDLYLAMKLVNGTHIYVKDAGSAGHYKGTDWLYAHFQQVSAGVWSMSVASPDGYVATSSSTVTTNTIHGLLNGRLYGHREDTSLNTISYYTEILGIPKEDAWGDRAIWSAVDGWEPTNDGIGIPAGFTSIYKKESFTPSNFAALDLTNTIYQELRFGMLANKDLIFKAGYRFTVAGEDTERPATSIMYNTGSYPQMYLVNLTKNDDGSWHVMMKVKRWSAAPTSGGSSVQTPDTTPFETDVTGNNLSEIMSTFLTNSNVTLYCTEVRGTHTHAHNNTKSFGNGYLQDFCICGEAMSEVYEFAHGIVDEAVMVKDSIWRAGNYALSTPDQEAPAGFNNIEMYKWNLNTTLVTKNGNQVPWGSYEKDMPLTCLDEADVSAYDEVWFAMKNVGGTGFYVRGATSYTGSDWLYYHLVKVNNTWTLSVSSPDGYVANNVQTGIVGNTLQKILQYHAKSDAEPWDSGCYPTKADGDTTTDVRIYFTEILGIIKCEHTAGVEYVSNGDGTHNEVCANCQTVMVENVACEGSEATCEALAACATCGGTYGDYAAHVAGNWVNGAKTCTVCGKVVETAAVLSSTALKLQTTSNVQVIEDCSTVEKANGFKNVYGIQNLNWKSSNLPENEYNQAANISAYSELWFALKLYNAKFVFVQLGKADIAGDANGTEWIYFHATKNADATWTTEVTYKNAVYVTATNQVASTLEDLLYDGGYGTTDGGAFVLYQYSGTDIKIYTTEVMGVFQTGISENAVNVWDHIWNNSYFGDDCWYVTQGGGSAPDAEYADVAAPVGFSKVTKRDFTTSNFDKTAHLNNSTDISKYSDLYFAMKVENGEDIYIRGASFYEGGDWLYVHLKQNNDGTWSKSFRSIDGYFNNTAQVNLPKTDIAALMVYDGSYNSACYPRALGDGTVATAYFTNVIGVLKCDGTNHTAYNIVSNGDGTHDVLCNCGAIIADNATCSVATYAPNGDDTHSALCACGHVLSTAACSGGTATTTSKAICATCHGGYGNKLCAHETTSIVSNDNGTHNEVCDACDEIVTANIPCSGNAATCTNASVCSDCGYVIATTLPHTGAWEDDSYVCSICGNNIGSVNTHYETQQDVALFENAAYAEKGTTAANTFDASAETEANVDLSVLTNGLTISGVANVKLNGVPFDATVANNILTINVIPYEVFGEYTLTATITVDKGKTFDVEMPVLIITDLITNNDGLLNVRKVLRGQDLTTPVTATVGSDVYAGYGNNGGEGTMNGTGYYKLGADITLSEVKVGAQNKTYYANVVYLLGTNAVPFTGTFDGAGYILSNFKAVIGAWNNATLTGGYTYIAQDLSGCTATSAGVTLEQEGSFFGIMNGLVKNVAFTNAKFGQYGNIMLGGTGVMEDVYVDVAHIQSPRDGDVAGTNAISQIVAPFAHRAHGSCLTMRNFVIDLNDAAFSGDGFTITTHYPALIGNGFGKAENVAVYGFDTAWINGAGLGNVLRKNFGEGDVSTDGSAVGIYVEYREGNANDTNGASFWMEGLHNDRWKVVNGMPYLKNVSVDGTASAPSTTPTVGDLDENFIDNDGTQYYIAWSADLGEYAMFIKNAMYDARGLTLAVGAADLEDMNTKQIIIGTYYDYGKYVFDEDDLSDDDEDYGVYLVDRTFFVLAESDEGFELAAQKFCRATFGYNEVWFDEIVSTSGVIALADINAEYLGTSRITFSTRKNMNTSTSEDQTKMGFSKYQPYTNYIEMHNTIDYFAHTTDTNKDGVIESYDFSKCGNLDTKKILATEKNWLQSDVIITADNGNYAQLCYLAHGDKTTFNAMVNHVVSIITAQKEANPNMKVINFMLEDNTSYCLCTSCKKFSMPSVTQQIFLNAVQKVLNTNGVGVGIEFFSYNAYSPAPILSDTDLTNLASIANTLGITYETETVTYDDTVSYKDKIANSPYRYTTVLKAEDGLRLWWTSHEANHSFPLEHEANAHMYLALQAWIASIGADNVDVFMYQATYRDYFIPLNTWEYQILWYQSLNNLGVNNHMFNLGDRENSSSARTGFSAFKTYIDSRAMRDSSVTFEQLKDEFFGVNGYYGPAGPTMRTFFEELVAVYEGHKQGGDIANNNNQEFVSTTNFTGKSSTYTDKNTLGMPAYGNGGYIANWFLNYYDKTNYPNYYGYTRQGFFNGSYGYNATAMLFGALQSSQTVKPVGNNVFVYSAHGTTQLATLEAWYNYCQEALEIGGIVGTKYENRIKLEMLLPEYLYLVFNSTYKGGSNSKTPSVTPTFPTTAGNGSSVITTTSYQDFYNRVKALGITKPSEFYAFDNPNNSTWQITSSYYIYQSFWKNWGITA